MENNSNDMVDLLTEFIKSRSPEETDSSILVHIEESIRQRPCSIQAEKGSPGEIIVSWTEQEQCSASKSSATNIEYRVTLHRESTCKPTRYMLLDHSKSSMLWTRSPHTNITLILIPKTVQPKRNSPARQYYAGCGCPEQIVRIKDHRAAFSGLSTRECYFPMVVRYESNAFYGQPPAALRPISTSQQRKITTLLHGRSSRPSTKNRTAMQQDAMPELSKSSHQSEKVVVLKIPVSRTFIRSLPVVLSLTADMNRL